MGMLVLYGVFHPNKTMFSKCWASPIQLYTVMNCLGTEMLSVLQAMRKCGEEGKIRCSRAVGLGCAWQCYEHTQQNGEQQLMPKNIFQLWGKRQKVSLGYEIWGTHWSGYLSLSVFNETVGEELCVFVCDVCTSTAHSTITKPQSALKW